MNPQVIDDVTKWRLEAQSNRREARAVPPGDSGRQRLLDAAVAALNRAISALRRELRAVEKGSGTSDEAKKLRELLSQTLGSLGGTYRDARDYPNAIKYYEEGNEIEERRRRDDNQPDSYNLVQRLVARFLGDAGQLTDEDFRTELARAQAELDGQAEMGRRDPWWLADAAVVRFLRNADAADLLAALEERKLETSFYESTYEAITALIDEGLGHNSPVGDKLRQFQEMLQRKGGLRARG